MFFFIFLLMNFCAYISFLTLYFNTNLRSGFQNNGLFLTISLFFSHNFSMEGTSSTQNAEIERFFNFFCQFIIADVSESVRFSEREKFSAIF